MQATPQIRPSEHSCINCGWFQFIEDVKPRNRACTYPGKLGFKDGVCMCWKNYLSLGERFLIFCRLKQPVYRSIVK